MMGEKNTGIKIENVFEEYKEQLKLMEKQYGQEEDLYPWIYMLLLESGKINDLSMRQVAGATWARSVRGREMLRGYVGFPDIAILDKDFCAINVNKSIKHKIKDIEEWLFDKENKPKKINSNKETKDFLREYWYLYNIDKIRGCIEVKGVGENLINIEPGEKEVIIDFSENDLNFKVGDKNSSSLLDKGIKFKDLVQLLGELLWYGKVLYTNGNEWKYLEVTKCSNNRKIKSIVDLRRILYEDYVNIHKPKKLWYEKISELQNKNKLSIKIQCASYLSEKGADEGNEDTSLVEWIEKNVSFEVY